MTASNLFAARGRLVRSLFLCLVALFLIDCGEKVRRPVPTPEAGRQRQVDKQLKDADLLYRAGSYDQAAGLFAALLELDEPPAGKDYLWFRLALSLTSGGTPEKLTLSRRHLMTILETYPDSPYVPEARMMLQLIDGLEQLLNRVEKQQGELQKLLDQLERLKEVDLKKPPVEQRTSPGSPG